MTEYRYFIKKIYQPDADLVVLELADWAGGPVFGFRPGQYVMISYKNAAGVYEDKHAFSIASSPTDQAALQLGIRVGGRFTRGLLRLREGAEVFVAGPFGNFIFDEKKYMDAVFIAGGIGITPFFSAIKYVCENGIGNKLTLLYSSRTAKGMAFFDELQALEKKHKNLKCLFSVTDESAPASLGNVINQRFNEVIISQQIGLAQGKTFFICGPAPFMEAMKSALKNISAQESQILTEAFSMIPDGKLGIKAKGLTCSLAFAAVIFAFALLGINNSFAGKAAPENKIIDLAEINRLNQAVIARLEKITQDKLYAMAELQKKLGAASPNAAVPKADVSNKIVKPVAGKPAGAVNQPAPIVSTPPPPAAYVPVVQQPVPTTRTS